ncbi:MAG: membrane dipeptidase, partial [Vicinamibacterales bacterium]
MRLSVVLILLTVPALTLTQPPQGDAALLTRAKALHKQVPLIDGHNDYPWALRENAASDLDKLDISKPQPTIMT